MANFNRGGRPGGFNKSGGRGGFERRSSFGDRGSRGPVEMHQAVCDNCGKNCEVPFRPTSGKPIYCSSCFERSRDSDSRPTTFEERRMFEAVCDECGNSCQVPFKPSGDKPIFCSNCFADKKGNGDRNPSQSPSKPQNNEQFELLNSKLDRILAFLTPNAVDNKIDVKEEILPVVEKKVKVAKKKPAKKKSLKV